MNLTILGVRYAHDTEFFQLFWDPEQAEQLKEDILASHSEDLVEGDITITELEVPPITASVRVYLEGKL